MDKLKSAAVAVQAWVMEHKKVSGAIAILLVGVLIGLAL